MAKDRGPDDQEARKVTGWLALARANRAEKRPAKCGVYLSAEGHRKLRVASVVEDLDQSVIVDALIRSALSGYKAYASAPGRADGEATGAD